MAPCLPSRGTSNSTSLAAPLFVEPSSAFPALWLRVHAPEPPHLCRPCRCRPDFCCIPGALDGANLHLEGQVNAVPQGSRVSGLRAAVAGPVVSDHLRGNASHPRYAALALLGRLA